MIYSQKKLVCSFYKFLKLKKKNDLQQRIYNICKKNNLLGTVLLANEGINASISGNKNNVDEVKDFFKTKIDRNIIFKINNCSKDPFLRLKVKIKREIVRLGVTDLKIKKRNDNYIKPEEWNDFIEKKDVILIDTRNEYESEIGYFDNSIFPNTKTFSELPNWIKNNEKILSDKKIAMYCTGGVRCEKASAYLTKEGFQNIYQLKGGILNYFKKVNCNHSKWRGECFVFDERVTLDHSLKSGNYTQCFACRSALRKKDLLSKNYVKGISCHKCFKKTTSKRKQNLKERQKQRELSRIRGIKYLGGRD